MKLKDGIKVFEFGIQKVLKKYGKWFGKRVGTLVKVNKLAFTLSLII